MPNFDADLRPDLSIAKAERLSVPLVRASHFEEPKVAINDHSHDYKPNGFYYYFCIHGKAQWEICGSQTCRRGAAEAKANRMKYLGV